MIYVSGYTPNMMCISIYIGNNIIVIGIKTSLQKGKKGFPKAETFNIMSPCLNPIHNTYNQQ